MAVYLCTLIPTALGYGNSFRPIHGVSSEYPADSSSSSSSSNYQTLVPTPVRNQRPPLLATPPGLTMLQQGGAECSVRGH